MYVLQVIIIANIVTYYVFQNTSINIYITDSGSKIFILCKTDDGNIKFSCLLCFTTNVLAIKHCLK
jgi:hypothetical protein